MPNDLPLWAAALLVVSAAVTLYGLAHYAAEAARPWIARLGRWRRVRRVRRNVMKRLRAQDALDARHPRRNVRGMGKGW